MREKAILVVWALSAAGCTGATAPEELDPARAIDSRGARELGVDHEVELSPFEVREDLPAPSGGALLLTRSGLLLAGDELTDRIYVVDVELAQVVSMVALAPGAMPGRMAEDDQGIVHAVLREEGAVARVDPGAPACSRARRSARRRAASPSRRRRWIHVACADGTLVALDRAHERVRELRIDPDLRDVVSIGERLYVSRFRSAELIVLSASGEELSRSRPPEREFDGVDPPARASPHVAWRLRAVDASSVMMAHQRMVSTDIGAVATTNAGGEVVYPAGGRGNVPSAIAMVAITTFVAGRPLASHLSGSAAGTPMDFAVLEVDFELLGLSRMVVLADRSSDEGRPVAVEAIDASRFARLKQDREVLLTIHDEGSAEVVVVPRPQRLSPLPRGREVFDRRTAAGIACASCHPEGHEDGHTWITLDAGARRSQSLLGGIRDTEPFHWGGELASFHELMDAQSTVLGTEFTAEDRTAMLFWLDAQPTVPGRATPAARSPEAFDAAGCGYCHGGPRLSDGGLHDVGAGAMQTPRLAGVLHRAPYFHDGCAASLEAAIDGSCRPIDRHGVADPELRRRVVEHLESL